MGPTQSGGVSIKKQESVVTKIEIRKEENEYLEYSELDSSATKEKIKLETKNKAGVFMLINTENHRKFIGVVKKPGSGGNRFYTNFVKLFNTRNKRYIVLKNEILELGVSKFKFRILEFTSEEDVDKRKSFYISKYKPEYNYMQRGLSKTEREEKTKTLYSGSLPFILPKTLAKDRVGPHPEIVMSLIYGTLLGDSYAERRSYNFNGQIVRGGTRISFQQESSNVSYLYSLWKILAEHGYCSKNKPKMSERIGSNGKRRFFLKLHT